MTDLALPALSARYVHPREGRLLAGATTATRDLIDARLSEAVSANGDEAVAKVRTDGSVAVRKIGALLNSYGRQTAVAFKPLLAFALTYPLLGPLLGVDIFAPHTPVWSIHSFLVSTTAAVAVVSMLAALFGCVMYFKGSHVDARTGRFNWETYEGTDWAEAVTWATSAVVLGRNRIYAARPVGTGDGVSVTEIRYDALGQAEAREGSLVLTDRRGDVILTMPSPRVVSGGDGTGDVRWLLDALRARIPE